MQTLFSYKIKSSEYKNTHAFTLIELIVSITILSMIMLSVFEIYSNILQINKRLEVMRIVQENVRNITEQMASDIREKGIDLNYYNGSPGHESDKYTGDGNTILVIKGGDKYYVMKETNMGVIIQCTTEDMQDPLIHCYMGKEDIDGKKTTISDSRVRIENIRFFLSGETNESLTNLSQEGKATIVLSIGIENKIGINSETAKSAHMSIQTTISEKVYKKN